MNSKPADSLPTPTNSTQSNPAPVHELKQTFTCPYHPPNPMFNPIDSSHLAKRMRLEGWYVICADWKDNEFMEPKEFCDEFKKIDLRRIESCIDATKDCNQV